VKFSYVTDGGMTGPDRPTYAERYKNLITEAIAAEEAGFLAWGTSETHFLGPAALPKVTVSAPDSLMGAIATQTETLIMRYMVMPIPFYNPIQCAERIATMDVISEGRCELGTGRGNNLPAFQVFGVEPKDTRPRWAESLRIIAKALMNEGPISYDGEFWQIDEIEINPRPVQKPMPAVHSVATGLDSVQATARMGIGAITWDGYFGWDYLEKIIAAYRGAVPEAEPLTGQVNDNLSFFTTATACLERREDAIAAVEARAFDFCDLILDTYTPLAKTSTYEYYDELERVRSYSRDLEKLMDIGPSVVAGDPDDLLKVCKRLEAEGVDEVVFSIDSLSHEHHMETIRLLGKYVIPEMQRESGRETAAVS
jgi:alkanesulfonate monooxygenase SsuD/methylene tetrahydromethanopterin reductase-like flavin-dependent oxidoreductase (luciferase family)